jgi:RNA-directed DNA polymerase
VTNKDIINKWNNFYDSKGIADELKLKYLNYIKILLDNNTPIIFDFQHLAQLLGRQPFYLASVVNSPSNHYREFRIKKRSGGYRLITAPFPALLEIQEWIYQNILIQIAINPCAHGFTAKKSIITSSKLHTGKKELLKLDLKDYFPSIKINRIISIFKSLGYPNIIAFYLASICSFEESLPQGAPTSPILSNIISRNLDKRLLSLSKKFKLKYTRYADDLTFSGDNIPSIFIEYATKIITNEGFNVNEAKTRLYKSNTDKIKGKRIVTGISVSEEKIKIPRNYKRELKQELHYIFTFGLQSHISKLKIKNINYLHSIIGKVNFWISVEPDNEYAIESRKKLIEIYKSNYILRV